MVEWDGILDEYLCTPGYATAAALANKSDFQFYAASPSAGDAGWGMIFAEDAERPIMQEDGTEKPTAINEASTLKDAVERDMKTDGPSPTGLWLGGKKLKVVQREVDVEAGDYKLMTLVASGPEKTGAHIAVTEKSVVVALFDEPKGAVSGNCKKAVIDFAAWLAGQGL